MTSWKSTIVVLVVTVILTLLPRLGRCIQWRYYKLLCERLYRRRVKSAHKRLEHKQAKFINDATFERVQGRKKVLADFPHRWSDSFVVVGIVIMLFVLCWYWWY